MIKNHKIVKRRKADLLLFFAALSKKNEQT